MTRGKSDAPVPAQRGEQVRQRVMDAAERLLRDGRAGFSMRELADTARVSFATPFNQFGSKAAIMHALSARRIDTMSSRFAKAPRPGDATARVLLATDIAVAVMLAEPDVNRAVMSWIGTAGPSPGQAWVRSTALWTLALGDGEGIAAPDRAEALGRLPSQLALSFRGALSFWTSGEMADDALGPCARGVAAALMRSASGPMPPDRAAGGA